MRKLYIATDFHNNGSLSRSHKMDKCIEVCSAWYRAIVLSQTQSEIKNNGGVDKIYLEGYTDATANTFMSNLKNGKIKSSFPSDNIFYDFLKNISSDETKILGAEVLAENILHKIIAIPEIVNSIGRFYALDKKRKADIICRISGEVSKYVKPLYKRIRRKRDNTFAKKINKTLEENEAAVLFTGMAHHPEIFLEKNIEIKRFETIPYPDLFKSIMKPIRDTNYNYETKQIK